MRGILEHESVDILLTYFSKFMKVSICAETIIQQHKWNQIKGNTWTSDLVLWGPTSFYTSYKCLLVMCPDGPGPDTTSSWQLCAMVLIYCISWVSLVAQTVKNPPAMQETWVQSLVQEDPLEEETATHSTVLSWEMPWIEKPSRVHSPQGHKELDKRLRDSLPHPQGALLDLFFSPSPTKC